jgi:hypothetical protein
MLFPPPNPDETHTFLVPCAARAASIKGLSGSEWYLEEEIINFLKQNHPDTFKLFIEFATAYKEWADLTHRHYKTCGDAPMDPATNMRVIDLIKKRDSTREAVLVHLGLKK